jgi:hypothetical protein
MHFAYPPFRGTRSECFRAINADHQIVPAEGLDLALIIQGMLNSRTPRWQALRDSSFLKYIFAPVNFIFMPPSSELSGVVVERDLQGQWTGRREAININLSDWRKNKHGLYVSPDQARTFVPYSRYSGKLQDHRLLVTILGEEGAEIFARTIKDARMETSIHDSLITADCLTEPERMGLFFDYNDGGLFLVGNIGLDLVGYAFGKRRIAE